MKTLHLNLYREYFDAILKGEKTTEYRDVTPYWSKRLEFKGIGILYNQTTITAPIYAIDLGKVLESKNVT